MAWYYPTYRCGHPRERINLIGPHRERERRLAFLEQQDCLECLASQANNQHQGFPPLTGTDKQVLWATSPALNTCPDCERHIRAREAFATQAATRRIMDSDWGTEPFAGQWIERPQ